jgi:undecaprenyl-diphosphatase
VLAHSGDSIVWLAFLFLAIWQAPPPYAALALICLVGMVFTGLLVGILKIIFRRSRPQGEWGQLYRRTDPHSLPSGHTARSLAMAVITCLFGPLWLAIVLVVWSVLMGIARIGPGVHYLSDVIAGFLIGGASGWVFYQGLVLWVSGL